MTAKTKPPGIRRNNPGNLRADGTPWQGLADAAAENGFCVFKDPTWGIRAMARVLITYQDKYGIRTIKGIVTKWAPPIENDTGAYIQDAADRANFDAEEVLDLHEYAALSKVIKALIWHENGMQPYTDAQIDKGLVMAGVQPPVKGSRIQAGNRIATAGIGLNVVADQVQQVQTQLSPLVDYGAYIKYVFLAVSLLGIALSVYARWDDSRKGVNP